MATKAELTTGSASAATEHTEEPQLAERPNNHSAATEHTQNKKKGKKRPNRKSKNSRRDSKKRRSSFVGPADCPPDRKNIRARITKSRKQIDLSKKFGTNSGHKFFIGWGFGFLIELALTPSKKIKLLGSGPHLWARHC